MPVTQSIKPNTGPRPYTLSLDNFQGGLNKDNSLPLSVTPIELVDILNFKYIVTADNKVKLKSRDGLTKVSTTSCGGYAIRDIGHIIDKYGNEFFLVAANQDLYYFASGTFTKIGDLSGHHGHMTVFNDKMIIADSGYPKIFDPASMTACSNRTDGSLFDNIGGTLYAPDAISIGSGKYVGEKITFSNWGSYDVWLDRVVVSLKPFASASSEIHCRVANSSFETLLEADNYFLMSDLSTSAYTNCTFVFHNNSNSGINLSPSTVYYIYFYLKDNGDNSNPSGNYLGVATSGDNVSIGVEFSRTAAGVITESSSLDVIMSVYTTPAFDVIWDKQGQLYDLTNYTGFTPLSGCGMYGVAFGYNYWNVAEKYTTPSWGSGIYNEIKTLTVSIKKVGSPTGDLVARVHDATGVTSLAVSQALSAADDITTSFAPVTFTFESAYKLSPGTAYYFGVDFWNQTSDGENYLIAEVVDNNQTPDYTTGGLSYYDTAWQTDIQRHLVHSIGAWALPPKAQFMANYKNRLFADDVAHPNRLCFCNINDANDWSSEDVAGYITCDGHYRITALSAFYDKLFVFLDHPKKVKALLGASPSDYNLQDVIKGVTAINQWVVKDAENDVIFLDALGLISLRAVEKYGDIESSLISKKIFNTYIKDYIPVISMTADNTDARSYIRSLTVFAGKAIADKQFWLHCTGHYIEVYDCEVGQFTRYHLELGDDASPNAFTEVDGKTYIGTSNGNIFVLDTSQVMDNSVNFDIELKTPWLDMETIMTKAATFADSVLISGSQETYDLDILTNLSTTAKKTLSLVSLCENGAYQSPYCGNLNEVNFNFKQVQFYLKNIASGKGPFWLDRIVLEFNILGRMT